MMKDTALEHCIKGIAFERQTASSSLNDPTFGDASNFRLFDQRLDRLDTMSVPSPIQEKPNPPASASAYIHN